MRVCGNLWAVWQFGYTLAQGYIMSNKTDWTMDEYDLACDRGIDAYHRALNGDAYTALSDYLIRALGHGHCTWSLLSALQDVSVGYYSGSANMMRKARARVRNTTGWRALSSEQRYRVRELFEAAFGFSYKAREAVK